MSAPFFYLDFPPGTRPAPQSISLRLGPRSCSARSAPQSISLQLGPRFCSARSAPRSISLQLGPRFCSARSAPRSISLQLGPRSCSARSAPQSISLRLGPRSCSARSAPRSISLRLGPRSCSARSAPRSISLRLGPRSCSARSAPRAHVRGLLCVSQSSKERLRRSRTESSGAAPAIEELAGEARQVRPAGPHADKYQPGSDFSRAKRSGGRQALQLPFGLFSPTAEHSPPPKRLSGSQKFQ